jgi:transcriptional regulator with XRE-family HTH domain
MIETFGDLVRFKREKNGFSLNGLANKTGLDVAYISKIEKNITKQPSFISVSKVAKALEITNEELATVFNVEMIKNESYKINDTDIKVKSLLSTMNDTIIDKVELLTEDSLTATIEILEKLKNITKTKKIKKSYIVMLGSLEKIDIVVYSHIYDQKVKEFIENVYGKDVAIAMEGSLVNISEERLTNLFDVIEQAKDNEYIADEDITEFEKYVRKQNV